MKKTTLLFISICFLFICSDSYCEDINKKDAFAAAKASEKQGNFTESKKHYTKLLQLSDNPQIKSYILKKIQSLDAKVKQPAVPLRTVKPYAKNIILPSTTISLETIKEETPIHKARNLEKKGKITEASKLYRSIISNTSSENVKRFAKKRIAILSAKEKGYKQTRATLKQDTAEPFLSEEQNQEINKKITKSRFLIQTGDSLLTEGNVEGAFKMYKFALETLA